MQRHIFFAIIFLFSTILLLQSSLSGAGPVPQLINYQGSLMKPDGSPVKNGQYWAVFNIYDVSTGGTPLWTETWNATPSDNRRGA